MKENVIQIKSYEFAKDIIFLYLKLRKQQMYELGSQVLRSGTSIGANVEEAIGAASKRDFLHKITISYKEGHETNYWPRLLRDTSIIEGDDIQNLIPGSEEIMKIIGSIQISTKTGS